MAITITETEKRHEVVNKLSAIDVKFISLVPQGANGESFTLVKNSNGGEADMAGPVIQSFVLPNTTEFEELKAQPGMEWLNEVDFSKATKKGYANFTRYTVLNKAAFDDASFETVPVGDGWAVVGKLKEGEGISVEKGAAVMMPDPIYSGNDSQISVGDMVRRESWAFIDSMDAMFRQSFADPKKRKTSIMNNLSNYWDALSALLDMAPAGIVKGAKIGERAVGKGADGNDIDANDLDSNSNSNEGEIQMTKEDVTAIVKEVLAAEKAAATPPVDTPAATPVQAETISVLSKGITELTVAVTKLQGDVTEIKEKGVAPAPDASADTPATDTPAPAQAEVAALAKAVEDLSKQVTGLLHSTNSPAPKTDGEPVRTEVEKSPFDGMYAKR